jgi:hypothetical protein
MNNVSIRFDLESSMEQSDARKLTNPDKDRTGAKTRK